MKVNPATLSEYFKSDTSILGAPVVSSVRELDIVESGATSTIKRLILSYEDLPGPKSVVVKTPSKVPELREMGFATGMYVREVKFYKDLSQESNIACPHCFYSWISGREDNFLLVLEDMATSQSGNMFESSVVNVEKVIRNMSKLHANWWGGSDLKKHKWLWSVSLPQVAYGFQESLKTTAPLTLEKYGDLMGDEFFKHADYLSASFTKIAKLFGSRTQTLIHGDLHLQQVFFPTAQGGRFAISDWQTVVRGFPGEDTARLITSSLSVSDRQNNEERLIKLYVEKLRGCGVVGYGFDEAWYDYRLGQIWNAVINLNAGSVSNREELRSAALRHGGSLEDFMARMPTAFTDLSVSNFLI